MPQNRNLSGCQVFDAEDLPRDWDCALLGSRIELAYGRALREEDRKPGPVDVYGSNGRVGSHHVALANGPGILIGRKGTIGAVHYADRPFWPIDTVYYVVTRTGDNPRFLYHLLNYLPLGFLNAATGVPGLSRRDAYALRGAFPSPSEQAVIARTLDGVATALERSRAAVERARDLERAVLEDAVDRLHAPQCQLRDFITDVRYGTSKASSDRSWGNPVLRIPNVVADRLSLDDLAFVELPSPDVDRLQLRDGDLLLVRTNGNPNYVGRSVVFRRPDVRTWVYASYLIRVRLTGRLLPEYVNVFLGLERGRRELLRRVTTSAGNHNINSNSIRLLRLPVPASEEAQARIVELAGAFRAHVDAIRTKARALEELKTSLMHDLLTGRVRVTSAIEAAAS
jgi:type I restriction enzyme S subunit